MTFFTGAQLALMNKQVDIKKNLRICKKMWEISRTISQKISLIKNNEIIAQI